MKRVTVRIKEHIKFIEDKLALDFAVTATNTTNVNVPISNNAGFRDP